MGLDDLAQLDKLHEVAAGLGPVGLSTLCALAKAISLDETKALQLKKFLDPESVLKDGHYVPEPVSITPTKATQVAKGGRLPEPLLDESSQRFVLFPIKYPIMGKYYEYIKELQWFVHEVELKDDMADWVKLTPDEQKYVLSILAFFAASDGIVNENLASAFSKEVQIPEARAFYGLQISQETIHSEMYSTLIQHYAPNPAEQEKLFNAVDHFPAVRAKAEWALKWIPNADTMTHEQRIETFPHRLVAFAAVEGIFFSSSFCAIFWLRKRQLLPGLCQSNQFISRDENLHCDFAILLFKEIVNLPANWREVVTRIICEAIQVEISFCKESLPVSLIGMNVDLMVEYVKYCGDRLLTKFGCNKVYNAKNPFDWMELISTDSKTDFFARKVTEYSQKKKMSGFIFARAPDADAPKADDNQVQQTRIDTAHEYLKRFNQEQHHMKKLVQVNPNVWNPNVIF